MSHQNRFIGDWPPDWGGEFSPHVLLRTGNGHLVYQEQLSTFLSPTPGTLSDTFTLRPGASLTRHVRFVLQAPQLQAVMRIEDGYISFTTRKGTPTPPQSYWAKHVWRITTPFTRVTIVRQSEPHITVTRSAGHIQVVVRPAWSASGPMFYMDSSHCMVGTDVEWTDQHVPWTESRTDELSMSANRHCRTPQPWHVVVGWLNHPVALLSYHLSH